jgi:hypothetical protein
MQELKPNPEQDTGERITQIRSENIGFSEEQMISCEGCGRHNPPNRLRCMYCSHALEIDPAQAELIKPKFEVVESQQNGFNVIVFENLDLIRNAVADISSFTGLEPAWIAASIQPERPIPLMRLGLENEAEFVVSGLGRLEINAKIIDDNSLMPDRSPIRLRSIDFSGNETHFIEFNGETLHTFKADDLALIVPGVLTESKTDQIEKRSRRKDPKIVDNVQTGNDEAVLDLYTKSDPVGFRVRMAGFDFSCLGAERSLLAVENIKRLTSFMREFSSSAKFVSDYGTVRAALEQVWPLDERKDTKGVQRGGFGKVEIASTFLSSNLRQFNKFSRLQWHLL